MKMTILADSSLGGELNPVSNNNDLRKAITGRSNCYIYTKGTFTIDRDILQDLKIKNIKLIGMAFAYFTKEIKKVVVNGISDITPKGIMSELSKAEKRYINGNKN